MLSSAAAFSEILMKAVQLHTTVQNLLKYSNHLSSLSLISLSFLQVIPLTFPVGCPSVVLGSTALLLSWNTQKNKNQWHRTF